MCKSYTNCFVGKNGTFQIYNRHVHIILHNERMKDCIGTLYPLLSNVFIKTIYHVQILYRGKYIVVFNNTISMPVRVVDRMYLYIIIKFAVANRHVFFFSFYIHNSCMLILPNLQIYLNKKHAVLLD